MGKWEWLTDPFGMRRLAEIYREDKRVAKTDSDGIPEVIPFLIIWRKKATALRVLHVLLGFSSVVFSLLTTTVLQFGNSNNNFLAKVFALIAAVSIGLMTAFNLGRKSKDMTNAWRGLVTAVMRYNNYKNVEKKDVIDAYAAGEKLIGDVVFDQAGGSTTPVTPVTPSTPVTPVTPSTPVTPVTPSTPVTPVTPSTPVTPTTANEKTNTKGKTNGDPPLPS